MPIYLYECEVCKYRKEEIQKMSDPPLEKCEKCGGKLKKLIGASSFRLKGGGWYSDGYSSTESGTDVARKTRESLSGNKGD